MPPLPFAVCEEALRGVSFSRVSCFREAIRWKTAARRQMQKSEIPSFLTIVEGAGEI